MSGIEFDIEVVGLQEWDVRDDNIDVVITLADGRIYTATFFTLRNIESLFKKNRETGECSDGTYMWATEMILVENLERRTLVSTINGLLQDHEIDSACSLQASEEVDRG